MATIRATCDDHDDIEVGEGDVTVFHFADEDSFFYRVDCPEGGGHRFTKSARKDAADLLLAEGCEFRDFLYYNPEIVENTCEGDPIDRRFLTDAILGTLRNDEEFWDELYGGENFKA